MGACVEDNLLATIDLVAPRIPAVWADVAALDRIRALSAHLPHAACCGLECRLDSHDGQVDLVSYVDDDTLRRLARAHAWTRLSTFLDLRDEHWPETLVAEFDLAAAGPPIPPPALFLPALLRSKDIGRLLPLLAWWDDPVARDGVLRLADSLPEPAEGGVGIYFSRPLQSLRFCVQGLQPDAWLAVLDALGGHPAVDRLTQVLARIAPLADHFSFTIDVGRALGPSLGVEIHLSRVPRIEPRWDALVDALEQIGIEAVQLEPVRAWAGSMAHLGPLRDLVQELLQGPPLHHLYWRVNHLKIAVRDGAPPEAKVYLMARQVKNNRLSTKGRSENVSK